MPTHHASAVVSKEGTIVVSDVPFPEGQAVEVTVRAENGRPPTGDRYPLRGSVLKYDEPTQPVCEDDWESAR